MSDVFTLIPSLIILTNIPAEQQQSISETAGSPPPHSAANGVGHFIPGGGGLISLLLPNHVYSPAPGFPLAIPGFTHRGHSLAVMLDNALKNSR